MKHSSARNIIERCFGLLKLRWAILRSPSYYLVKTHSRIIIACCLLHNLIRRNMITNPLEHQLDVPTGINLNEVDAITQVETSDAWSEQMDTLARQMFDEWRSDHQRLFLYFILGIFVFQFGIEFYFNLAYVVYLEMIDFYFNLAYVVYFYQR